jgi:afadin
MAAEREGPMLVEITHSGDGGRRVKLTAEPIEVGSANTNALQLFGPSIQPRHCLISLHEGVCTVTPLHADGLTFVNGHHITQPTILHVSQYYTYTYFYFILCHYDLKWGKFSPMTFFFSI